MRFLLTLQPKQSRFSLPINYQYPLSAAIYKILDRADTEYALFLHESGYKGYKLFTFSDLRLPFKIEGDRLISSCDAVKILLSFYIPEASQHFIKGLFLSQEIDIADKKSKATFTIASVEALPHPFAAHKPHEVLQATLLPVSPCVAGVKNSQGNYDFLAPEDARFASAILYNWKEKIKTVFPDVDTDSIILSVSTAFYDRPPKSRLVTIKAGTPAESKIRGFNNFRLQVIGEQRFVTLLYDSGIGLYNAQGMGMVVKEEA